MDLKVVSFLLFVARGESGKPCCQACPPGTEKFFSIPEPDEPNPQCGECCLDPKHFKLWKLFEPKLEKGDCVSQGFAKYVSTETDGVWPLAVTNDRYVRDGSVQFCPEKLDAVYADMHDGDKKEITISGTSMTIKPSGNNQTWVVRTEIDPKTCSAVVDFNIPGKPSPPPVNLTATLWYSWSSARGKKTEFEFTDPGGTLPAGPLNRWLQITKQKAPQDAEEFLCEHSLAATYADMHDGDQKEVTISGTKLIVKPSGNNQTWVVTSQVDSKTCSAVIDFNVPGKPSPPPVKLTATLWYTMSAANGKKTEIEFTDPSGTLADASFPLNAWVEIARQQAADVIV